ncbi:hypothetical protein SDC9_164243 [bioreactor metagenome]|uniref:Uncharacterized protein n=1 Tax=bioreactor metagenome TaxID=1076179 RepID=A0A645FT43_9ZZZZ
MLGQPADFGPRETGQNFGLPGKAEHGFGAEFPGQLRRFGDGPVVEPDDRFAQRATGFVETDQRFRLTGDRRGLDRRAFDPGLAEGGLDRRNGCPPVNFRFQLHNVRGRSLQRILGQADARRVSSRRENSGFDRRGPEIDAEIIIHVNRKVRR